MSARVVQRGTTLPALLIFAGVVFVAASWFHPPDTHDRPRDSTDAPNGPRSGMVVRVDAMTGCQYLSAAMGGLTPRLGPDGRHLCGAGVPR